jgi:hypothetical protein
MSEIDPRVSTPLLDWSELGVSGLLPTGMATLLLADVEGSTRLWETQPEEMTAAITRLNQTVSEVVAAQTPTRTPLSTRHRGKMPTERPAFVRTESAPTPESATSPGTPAV